jgi:hypothetical protein
MHRKNESATIDAWDETFLAELIAPDGSSYIETQISMPIDTENYASPSAYFALPERENREGSWIYCLSRLSDKEEYTTKSATFISLPQKYDECFEVNNYLLFKNESIAPDPDRPIISYTSINPSIHSNYYIGFCGISKLKDTDKSYEYEIKIRTQTGLTKYETVGTFISQDDEERNRLWTFQEPVDFSDYENGEYAVEIYFLGEKVLNAPFRIGNEEEGEYNLFNIQTRPPIGEKKRDRPDKRKRRHGLFTRDDRAKQSETEHCRTSQLCKTIGRTQKSRVKSLDTTSSHGLYRKPGNRENNRCRFHR